MSNDVEQVRQSASRVNTSLMDYILTLPEDEASPEHPFTTQGGQSSAGATGFSPVPTSERQESTVGPKSSRQTGRETAMSMDRQPQTDGAPAVIDSRPASRQSWNLDYDGTVNALTLQFLNEHEATRVAALNWLIMLQRKAPPGRQVRFYS